MILHSFQHIAHLSHKFDHLKKKKNFSRRHLETKVSPKIINAINLNSKNKNRKIDFFNHFSTVGIFHENMATSEGEGDLHILSWE